MKKHNNVSFSHITGLYILQAEYFRIYFKLKHIEPSMPWTYCGPLFPTVVINSIDMVVNSKDLDVQSGMVINKWGAENGSMLLSCHCVNMHRKGHDSHTLTAYGRWVSQIGLMVGGSVSYRCILLNPPPPHQPPVIPNTTTTRYCRFPSMLATCMSCTSCRRLKGMSQSRHQPPPPLHSLHTDNSGE